MPKRDLQTMIQLAALVLLCMLCVALAAWGGVWLSRQPAADWLEAGQTTAIIAMALVLFTHSHNPPPSTKP